MCTNHGLLDKEIMANYSYN